MGKPKKWEVMHSSAKTDWGTPQDVFEEANRRWGSFEFDVCATAENTKVHDFFFHEDESRTFCGLRARWASYARQCWMNPPYGREIGAWVEKANREAKEHGVRTCALLPARTDTKWFQQYCIQWPIVYVKGRITFEGAPAPAPFPSIFVLFGYSAEERGEPTFTWRLK